jgi:hypothetical protein
MNGGSNTGEWRRFAFAAHENFTPLRNAGYPPSCSGFADSRQAWVNSSHHGSDEQAFGAKQQSFAGGSAIKTSICQ